MTPHLGGRRRSINAQQLAAKAVSVSGGENEVRKIEEETRQERPEVLSFVGLKECPNCKKPMNRGLPMHYKACVKKP